MHRSIVFDLYKCVEEQNESISRLNEKIMVLKDKLTMNKVSLTEDNEKVCRMLRIG